MEDNTRTRGDSLGEWAKVLNIAGIVLCIYSGAFYCYHLSKNSRYLIFYNVLFLFGGALEGLENGIRVIMGPEEAKSRNPPTKSDIDTTKIAMGVLSLVPLTFKFVTYYCELDWVSRPIFFLAFDFFGANFLGGLLGFTVAVDELAKRKSTSASPSTSSAQDPELLAKETEGVAVNEDQHTKRDEPEVIAPIEETSICPSEEIEKDTRFEARWQEAIDLACALPREYKDTVVLYMCFYRLKIATGDEQVALGKWLYQDLVQLLPTEVLSQIGVKLKEAEKKQSGGENAESLDAGFYGSGESEVMSSYPHEPVV